MTGLDTSVEWLNEQARGKGVRPLRSVDDLRQDDLWHSDEALDAFLAIVADSRHPDLG